MRNHFYCWVALTSCLLTVFLTSAGFRFPGTHPAEATYARAWAAANGGTCEVRNPDGTRVDVLTATEAVEVEFAPKWAEAIGQSLYYAAVTGKAPAIVLICGPKDDVYPERIKRVCERWGLTIAVHEVPSGVPASAGVPAVPRTP